MNSNIGIQIMDYFTNNMENYLISAREHIMISLLAFLTTRNKNKVELLKEYGAGHLKLKLIIRDRRINYEL